MSIFQDVTLGFKGEEYTIPSNKVMKLIAIIEDIVSLQDLTNGKGPKLNKLAEAFSVALNYAGAKVEVEEVYASLFVNSGGELVSGYITSLIMMMLPPDSYNPPVE
jgi:hypothetical protein